jgi:hypothetical protein
MKKVLLGFTPQPSMIFASRKTYQKISLNDFDLAELEPKPVNHRQISIDPLTAKKYQWQCVLKSKPSSELVIVQKFSPRDLMKKTEAGKKTAARSRCWRQNLNAVAHRTQTPPPRR